MKIQAASAVAGSRKETLIHLELKFNLVFIQWLFRKGEELGTVSSD